MRRIYKYDFIVTDVFTLDLPNIYRVVLVETQGNIPCVWIELDTEEVVEPRTFFLFGTGHAIYSLPLKEHVGSFQQGPFVWHLYQEIYEESVADSEEDDES